MTSDITAQNDIKPEKEILRYTKRDFLWVAVFYAGMIITGWGLFPIGLLIIAICLINSFRNNRYDFVIQCAFFGGGFTFFNDSELPFKPGDLLLAVSLIGASLYKKDRYLRRVSMLLWLYIAGIFAISLTSLETLAVQIRIMRIYFGCLYVFYPLMFFAGREFDIREFVRRILAYILGFSILYILDCYIINGHLFLPESDTWSDDNSAIHIRLLSFIFPRMAPFNWYFAALLVFPLMRFVKFSRTQWVILLLGILTTKTMSIYAGLVISFALFQNHLGRIVKYAFMAASAFVILYFIDSTTDTNLRIKSNFDQFAVLINGTDEEALAKFGTGRMAQFIPKYERLCELDREWLGFGFIHPEYSTNPKFIIENDMYEAIEAVNHESVEVATGVEVTQLQTVLNIGIIGLLFQTFIFVAVYFVIKPLKYSKSYAIVLTAISLFGFGGMAGLTTTQGLIILSLALSSVFLANKRTLSDEY